MQAAQPGSFLLIIIPPSLFATWPSTMGQKHFAPTWLALSVFRSSSRGSMRKVEPPESFSEGLKGSGWSLWPLRVGQLSAGIQCSSFRISPSRGPPSHFSVVSVLRHCRSFYKALWAGIIRLLKLFAHSKAVILLDAHRLMSSRHQSVVVNHVSPVFGFLCLLCCVSCVSCVHRVSIQCISSKHPVNIE